MLCDGCVPVSTVTPEVSAAVLLSCVLLSVCSELPPSRVQEQNTVMTMAAHTAKRHRRGKVKRLIETEGSVFSSSFWKRFVFNTSAYKYLG